MAERVCKGCLTLKNGGKASKYRGTMLPDVVEEFLR